MLSLDKKIDLAKLARSRSYSPYSKFGVGAVCIFKDDSYVLGCNIENASYGITNCAERSAIFSAVSSFIYPNFLYILFSIDTYYTISFIYSLSFIKEEE